MKKAKFFKKLKNKIVQCQTCAHYCVISPGQRGICGIRENKNGELFLLTWGKAIAVNLDPIEKKPFYHFLPGTSSLSFATVGCNFSCPWCQNYEISQSTKDPQLKFRLPILGEDWPPKKLVKTALSLGAKSLSYTYTEPTVFFEYALDTMKLAKKAGLKNNWVTNGYMTEKVQKAIIPFLDAVNIDLKFFSQRKYQRYCRAKLTPVLKTIKEFFKAKVHIEITTLIIPKLNDSEKELSQIAQFIADLSPLIPWHISRFFPAYKFQDVSPTPFSAIEKAVEIGKKAGLKFIYTGNLPDSYLQDTICPKCKAVLIKRRGYKTEIVNLTKTGRCQKCGFDAKIIVE